MNDLILNLTKDQYSTIILSIGVVIVTLVYSTLIGKPKSDRAFFSLFFSAFLLSLTIYYSYFVFYSYKNSGANKDKSIFGIIRSCDMTEVIKDCLNKVN